LTSVYGIVTRNADIREIFAGSRREDTAGNLVFFKESKSIAKQLQHKAVTVFFIYRGDVLGDRGCHERHGGEHGERRFLEGRFRHRNVVLVVGFHIVPDQSASGDNHAVDNHAGAA
jgi:hypothetical protein